MIPVCRRKATSWNPSLPLDPPIFTLCCSTLYRLLSVVFQVFLAFILSMVRLKWIFQERHVEWAATSICNYGLRVVVVYHVVAPSDDHQNLILWKWNVNLGGETLRQGDFQQLYFEVALLCSLFICQCLVNLFHVDLLCDYTSISVYRTYPLLKLTQYKKEKRKLEM